ncbi:30S ribosomal protein S17 [uncultured archaeon]|nr:30S ribosomal protein S17 [uncultured archaeon]
MKKQENEKKQKEKSEIGGAACSDKKCHLHGDLKIRGRTFEGRVTKKLPTRVTIELERRVYSRKFERYFKSKTKIHAHLAECMEKQINIGDLIKIQECRPLSKIIHFTVIKKIKNAGER